MLTIGMATFSDFSGVWLTVQALRLYHPEALRGAELLVVDNNPGDTHGHEVKNFLGWVKDDVASARYIPFTDAIGPANAKDRVFREAQGEYVLCMDSHVMLAPGALKTLMDYYAANPDTRDLLSGPMVYDDLTSTSTHFADEWRGEMWGTWATALKGGVLSPVNGVVEVRGNSVCPLTPGLTTTCAPVLDGNVAAFLKRHGCRELESSDPAFEIPAMGTGLLSCRKDAWLGFNPNFSGFGGEEFYIHTKFRQAGAKCLCLPGLRWLHRFGRPEGVKYPLDRWQKVRNYVIGHQELGIPLDRLREHFVGLLDWEYLLADPIGHKAPKGQMTNAVTSLDALFAEVRSTPRDLDKHADKIREIVSKADSVAAFVKRKEWNVILAAGRPRSLTVYQLDQNPYLERVHAAVTAEQTPVPRTYTTTVGPEADSLTAPPTNAELLVIDTIHHAERLKAELARHVGANTKRILLHCTGWFGDKAEGGGPGLFHAMSEFIEATPGWFATYHSQEHYGLTLFSRDPADPRANNIHFGGGPGTEMKAILSGIGINPSPTCDCNGLAAEMDVLGVEGCRRERERLVKRIQENKERWGWSGLAKGALTAIFTGLAFKINPLDPVGSLFDLAVTRAETKTLKEAA